MVTTGATSAAHIVAVRAKATQSQTTMARPPAVCAEAAVVVVAAAAVVGEVEAAGTLEAAERRPRSV